MAGRGFALVARLSMWWFFRNHGSVEWMRRGMRLPGRFVGPPPVHMLRGMQLSGMRWPFASVDSTDVALNHNRPHNTARAMVDGWDAQQCAGRWVPRNNEQLELIA